MAEIRIEKLTKRYGTRGKEIEVVHGLDLTINDGEFMVLVGPSGCGKSTTLRMLAGLEEISGGSISIDGRVVNDVPPKDRDIAMVFQNYALYPHMSVYNNMAFGLKIRGIASEEIKKRVADAAKILGLEGYLERKPRALSGGQRQRVAVGRAIVRQPKVFLFDEPLSNLDAKMRTGMRTDISKLHSRLGATMVYVTHDQVEAMTMGDRICVLNQGEIMQVATPIELYERPRNKFVAGFLGSPSMNFFAGRLAPEKAGDNFIEQGGEEPLLRLDSETRNRVLDQGSLQRDLILGIRPEDISVTTSPESGLLATLELVEPMGSFSLLHLTTSIHTFIAQVPPSSAYVSGQKVGIQFNAAKAHLFDAETEKSLFNG